MNRRWPFAVGRGMIAFSHKRAFRSLLHRKIMTSKYRDLLAWQRSMDLVDDVYRVVRAFPDYELYRLAAQMRAAASSIPSNIAEGQGRYHLRDFRRFLRQARASGYELETQILIAERQSFVSSEESQRLIDETRRVLQLINGLLRHVNQRINSSRPTANGERPT
jgi:four helix bundle protein